MTKKKELLYHLCGYWLLFTALSMTSASLVIAANQTEWRIVWTIALFFSALIVGVCISLIWLCSQE